MIIRRRAIVTLLLLVAVCGGMGSGMLPPCTVVDVGCPVTFSLFGSCCLAAGTYTFGATPAGGTSNDTPPAAGATLQCGYVTKFGTVGPCSRLTTLFCGGLQPSFDGNCI